MASEMSDVQQVRKEQLETQRALTMIAKEHAAMLREFTALIHDMRGGFVAPPAGPQVPAGMTEEQLREMFKMPVAGDEDIMEREGV
jgi:hypothetical protein